MAFIPVVFAAVSSAVAAVSAVVGTVVSAASFFIANTFFAGSIGTALAISGAAMQTLAIAAQVALAFGISALTTPKIHAADGGSPVQFKADPDAGIPYAMGRCGLGGNIVAALTSNGDKNKYLHYNAVYSTGPIDSFETFTANEIAVTFDGSGRATSSPYAGKMGLKTQLGAVGDPALPSPTGFGTVPEWDSTHKTTGYAASRWALQSDNDTYPTGVPKPLMVGKWVRVYDPRLDSTYPGGSGSHRSNDESTWTWSENPWLHALAFCLGRYQNGKRVIGIGAPVANIDVASFVDAANVAEDNGWTIAGMVTSKDGKNDVLQAIGQAGGGSIVRLGGKIAAIINTPRSSIATITGDDIVAAVNIPGSQPRRTRINSVLPRYVSEAHKWEMVPASPVSIGAYVTADGGLRQKGVDFPLVTQVDQVAQLAAYGIYDSRELSPIVLTVKPYLAGLKAGDVITVDEPEYGLNGQELLVLTRERNPQNACVTLTCRTETTAKHAAALGLTGTPPPTPSLTGVDVINIPAPASGNWNAVGQTLTSASGVSFPAIVVTGTPSDNAQASFVVIQYRPHDGPTWSDYGVYAIAPTMRVEVTNVTPDDEYDVSIQYMVRGVRSERLEISNITAGGFAASGGSAVVTPSPLPNWGNLSVSSSSPAIATGSAETISGITTAIELKPAYSSGSLYYQVNGGAWTAITSGSTFFVSAGDSVAWQMRATSTVSGTVTITNVTDSNATVDTFTYSNTVTTGVTPNPMDWANCVSANSWTNTALTFSGLTTSITLRFDVSEYGDPGTVQYRKNGGSYVGYSNGSTLSVANGDTLNFRLSGGGPNTSIITSVVNTSDGDAIIDTFGAYVITITI